MSTFKTKQYVDLSFTIKGFSESENTDLTQINAFVNALVISLANDNRLFNERMFRGGCGRFISQDCIIINTGVKTNGVPQRKYNKRFI